MTDPDWREVARGLGEDLEAWRDSAVRIVALMHRSHDGHRRGVPWTACQRVECIEARAIMAAACDSRMSRGKGS